MAGAAQHLVRLLVHLREAALHRAWSGEGTGFLLVVLDGLLLVAMVGAAYGLSCWAHGALRSAPRLVRLVRSGTVVLLVAGLLAAATVAETVDDRCFRTCAPFPS